MGTIQNVILIIEDDPDLADCLQNGLSEENYRCWIAPSGHAAELLLERECPDLVLLDLGLPDMEGSELLKIIRLKTPNLPVIVTTARSSIGNRVNLLDSGADDYLVKPYAFDELLARIRIQFRHSERGREKQIIGDLSINRNTRMACRAGHPLDLSPLEFDLLSFLAWRQGETVSREMLQQEVWKRASTNTSMDNAMDVSVSRLRQKLTQPDQTQLLYTVRGAGFMLKGKE